MDSRLAKMLSSRPESVTMPTKARALEILQHSSVSIPWGFYVDDIGNMEGLVLIDDKALVQFIARGKKLELHICCKLRDRARMGDSFTKHLKWVAQSGWTQIYTTAPDDRVALKRMLKNLGFSQHNARWIYHGHGPGNDGSGISGSRIGSQYSWSAIQKEGCQQSQ